MPSLSFCSVPVKKQPKSHGFRWAEVFALTAFYFLDTVRLQQEFLPVCLALTRYLPSKQNTVCPGVLTIFHQALFYSDSRNDNVKSRVRHRCFPDVLSISHTRWMRSSSKMLPELYLLRLDSLTPEFLLLGNYSYECFPPENGHLSQMPTVG